jgi:hypothetical protein
MKCAMVSLIKWELTDVGRPSSQEKYTLSHVPCLTSLASMTGISKCLSKTWCSTLPLNKLWRVWQTPEYWPKWHGCAPSLLKYPFTLTLPSPCKNYLRPCISSKKVSMTKLVNLSFNLRLSNSTWRLHECQGHSGPFAMVVR